jgi:hypothetical protein
MVFDNVARTFLGPREHGESQFAFLDRSGRPQFETVRQRIEEWFSRLCPGLKKGVLQRLRSGDDQEFEAGFWELYCTSCSRGWATKSPANPPSRTTARSTSCSTGGMPLSTLRRLQPGDRMSSGVLTPGALVSTGNSTRSRRAPS